MTSVVRVLLEWAKLREAREKRAPDDTWGAERFRLQLEALTDEELRDVAVLRAMGAGDVPHELAREVMSVHGRESMIELLMQRQPLSDYLVAGMRNLARGRAMLVEAESV